MSLEKELETYRRELPGLLSHAGKFALVRGEKVISVWGTYEDALQEGYRLFALDPFMVQQIQPAEVVHHVTRPVDPVCPS